MNRSMLHIADMRTLGKYHGIISKAIVNVEYEEIGNSIYCKKCHAVIHDQRTLDSHTDKHVKEYILEELVK